MLADIKSNDDYCHYCWDLYSIYCLPDAILTCLCLTKRGKKSHYEEGAPSTLTVWMWTLRFREAKQWAQGHTGVK